METKIILDWLNDVELTIYETPKKDSLLHAILNGFYDAYRLQIYRGISISRQNMVNQLKLDLKITNDIEYLSMQLVKTIYLINIKKKSIDVYNEIEGDIAIILILNEDKYYKLAGQKGITMFNKNDNILNILQYSRRNKIKNIHVSENDL